MKNVIALALVLVIALSLAGCCCCVDMSSFGMKKCDLCGEMGMHPNRRNILGSSYPVCDDCYHTYSYLFE